MGTSSDRKFNNRISKILDGLKDNSDGEKFEKAHMELGSLLGYEAGNTEEIGGPDPWWIAGIDFCLVAEDYTETDGSKPIPMYKVRQVNDHPIWLSERNKGLSQETELVRVIITPANKIEEATSTISKGVTYWNQADFLSWANRAIQVVRDLRLDFTGPGNEKWKTKAMSVYKEAGLDPISIKSLLSNSPLTNLVES